MSALHADVPPAVDVAAILQTWNRGAGAHALDGFEDRLRASGFDPDCARAMRAIAHHEITAALPLCDSPIERDMLPWLVTGAYRSIFTTPLPVVRPNRPWATLSIYSAVLWPQFQVGKFRLDFALAVRRRGKAGIFAIERDGVQFHTTEQDALRDAALKAGGITTIRATGREIRDCPTDIVTRISDAVFEWTVAQQMAEAS